MAEMNSSLIEGMPTANNTVSESGLTLNYGTPDTTPDPDFDDIARGAIDDIAAEFYASDEPPETEPVEAETASTPDGAPQASEDEPSEDEPVDPKLERGVSRLVARELAAKEREQAADRKLAELRQLEASLAPLKGLKSTKELLELADTDPFGLIKTMGKDPDEFIRLAMAQSLESQGAEVPEGLRKYVEKSSTDRKIKALESKIAEQERARAANEYYNSISSGAREYVKNVDVKKFPTLAPAAAADADFVHREIMEEIVRESQVRAAQDPDGEPMSYEDAAKIVDSRWTKLKALLAPGPNSTQTQVANKIVSKPGKVTPPQTKPAARPLAPWQSRSDDDPFELGIQEAMREYNRVETARKAARR